MLLCKQVFEKKLIHFCNEIKRLKNYYQKKLKISLNSFLFHQIKAENSDNFFFFEKYQPLKKKCYHQHHH